MTKKKKKRTRDEIPAIRRLGSEVLNLGEAAGHHKAEGGQGPNSIEIFMFWVLARKKA